MQDVNVGRSRSTTSARPNGRSMASVAKELGLRDSVLRRWVDKFRQEPTAAAWRPTTQPTPMSADQASEIARLHQDSERLRMERDILEKSIAIFEGRHELPLHRGPCAWLCWTALTAQRRSSEFHIPKGNG